MNRQIPLFSALALGGALAACFEPVDEPIDVTGGPDAGAGEVLEEAPEDVDAIFGVFELGTLWDEDTITVCWEEDAMAPELSTGRSQVEIGARRWEAVTRIDFVGWDACATTPNPDIRIANTEWLSMSELGITSRGETPSMWINLGCVVPQGGCVPNPGPMSLCNGILVSYGEPPPLEECVRTLAVHEFGHALGLRHEHAHADSTCAEADEDIDQPTLDGEELWSYDPSSVMNYCVWSDDLSAGDVKAITTLYPSQVMVYGGTSPVPWDRVVVGPGFTSAAAVPGLYTGESIVVSPGLTATLCSLNGCYTYGAGRHELAAMLKNQIQWIDVTPRASVHTSRGFRGTAFSVANGTYHANNGSLPATMNNNIESVYLGHNFDVRMCTDVGKFPIGAGICGPYSGGPEWDQAVFVKLGYAALENTVSYVEVIPKVAFYDDPKFRGLGATFRVGTYYPGAPFTNARSVTVPPALYVYACDDVTTQGGPAGVCRVYNHSVDLPADHAAKLKYINVQYK